MSRMLEYHTASPLCVISHVDRQHPRFSRISHSFSLCCLTTPSPSQVLADYSQSQYNEKWSQGVWWDREVILYSDGDVEKSHPVLSYLVGEGRARAVMTVAGGCVPRREHFPPM